MGYGVYEHRAYPGRFGGYMVPAVCDQPGCDKEIDRGLEYACGSSPTETCGKYFCGKHLHYWDESKEALAFSARLDEAEDGDTFDALQAEYDDLDDENSPAWPRCARCTAEAWNSPEYPKKAEREEWIEWVKTEISWAEYRNENPHWEEEWRTSDYVEEVLTTLEPDIWEDDGGK